MPSECPTGLTEPVNLSTLSASWLGNTSTDNGGGFAELGQQFLHGPRLLAEHRVDGLEEFGPLVVVGADVEVGLVVVEHPGMAAFVRMPRTVRTHRVYPSLPASAPAGRPATTHARTSAVQRPQQVRTVVPGPSFEVGDGEPGAPFGVRDAGVDDDWDGRAGRRRQRQHCCR